LSLTSREVEAISTLLREAKLALATAQQRAAALEDELQLTRREAELAQDAAQRLASELAEKCQEHADVCSDAAALNEQLGEAHSQCDVLKAELAEAIQIRDHRMWTAEARAQDLEGKVTLADERAAAAESREWDVKARLTRVREALEDAAAPTPK
jgi:chromosome segregation ATPase